MKWHYRFLWQAVFAVLFFSFLFAQNENNLLTNGSFEVEGPYRWNAEEGAGATLTWATDDTHTGLQSLKIEKTGTGEMSRWLSDNQVRYWVTEIGSGVDIKVGAWVKTEDVNTDPADEDEKWQLKFWFFDEDDDLIGGVPFILDIDQSQASRDWYADTNAVGSLNLDVAAKKLLISAEAGPNATGTVWFDSFIFIGRDGWAGQNWNGFVTATEGWQYWIAPSGGNDGQSHFTDFGITDEHAHTGDYSLKLHAPEGRPVGEWVWFSETIGIPAGSEGKQYVLSAWVRTEDIIPDSVFNPEYALGFTWTWHTDMFEDGGGWNEVAGADYRFVLTRETTGWTQYQAIMTVPRDDVEAVSVRLRSWHEWTGTAFFDDVEMVEVLEVPTSVDRDRGGLITDGIPNRYQLLQNYPNPFNPVTTIEYHLPESGMVTIEVYNLLGQRVRTLVSEEQNAGQWRVVWDARDDYGRPVSTGMYIYRLTTGQTSLVKKMLLLK